MLKNAWLPMVASKLFVANVTDVMSDTVNASTPMEVTDAGIWTAVIFELFMAYPAMITTPSGIVKASAGLPKGY